MKKALVIQGGGFRTAFSAGVLDALMIGGIDDFDALVGVSGGAVTMSYFLAAQPRKCYEAISVLASDPYFIRKRRAMTKTGYMDIDHLEHIALVEVPLDFQSAIENAKTRSVHVVATDRETGCAVYLRPTTKNWIDSVIASCTLPFITKGKHPINGKEYFDGGLSDPIPVQWIHDQGATDILVIRTAPADLRMSKTWPDHLGSWYFKRNKALSDCFFRAHERYNAALDFMEDPPHGSRVTQIAPLTPLGSGTYSYSSDSVIQDYRHGLELGEQYVRSQDERRAKKI